MVLLCICEPMYDLCRIYFHILASMRSPQASQRSKGISGLVKDPKIRLSSLPHLGQQFCPKVPTMSLTEAPRRQGGQWILLKNWSERLHKNSECYEFIWILGVVPILFIPIATPFRHDSPLPPSKASEPGAMPISLISAMHKVITRNRYTKPLPGDTHKTRESNHCKPGMSCLSLFLSLAPFAGKHHGDQLCTCVRGGETSTLTLLKKGHLYWAKTQLCHILRLRLRWLWCWIPTWCWWFLLYTSCEEKETCKCTCKQC